MRPGVDLISVRRIEAVLDRHGARFLDRVYTPAEQEICGGDPRRLAARYAGKEAVSKALGTGIGRAGIRFADIEILCGDWGEPRVLLHGAAQARLEALGGVRLEISLSHEEDYALAFCIMSGGGGGSQ